MFKSKDNHGQQEEYNETTGHVINRLEWSEHDQHVQDMYNSIVGTNQADMMKLYSTMDSIALARCMDKVKLIKDMLDTALKEINKEYDFLRLNAVPNRFEEEGIENLKIDGIGRISLTGDIYVSIVKGCKDDAYEFFRDNGLGDIITETVNASTLKSTIKNMVKNGEDYPDKFFKVTPFTRATITKR